MYEALYLVCRNDGVKHASIAKESFIITLYGQTLVTLNVVQSTTREHMANRRLVVASKKVRLGEVRAGVEIYVFTFPK